jgi:cytochrome c biogenesis protein CcmG/thiol:disulfide interchange protein DsbE
MFPVIVLTVLVMVPVVWATRQSAGLKRLPKPVRITLLIAAALTVIGMAMRQPGLGFFLKAHKQLAILHGWPRQLLHVVVYWPIGYLMVIAIGKRWRNRLLRPSALLLLLAGVTIAADSSGLPAVLQPENERKAAPELLLEDSSGKTMKWEQYRGKVVLLDFWATWCTGCKKEIPWFSEFQKIYGAKGFAVVGVSMDDGGWKVVKPFLAENHVPYRMLLGNDSSTEQYGIATLPDSFLIDRQGRVAASYRGAIVDKDNVEANIKALISERQ